MLVLLDAGDRSFAVSHEEVAGAAVLWELKVRLQRPENTEDYLVFEGSFQWSV